MTIPLTDQIAAVRAQLQPWRSPQRTALCAALVTLEASAWQPIETAPRDGRKILLWDGAFITICRWGNQRCWVSAWDGARLDVPGKNWRPLPEPPR